MLKTLTSLRSPERGLKYIEVLGVKVDNKSLRSPERGLKFEYTSTSTNYTDVAPFAGAWIEIC